MMQSAFGNAGQRCLAGSVAVIVGDEARREQVRSVLADAAPRACPPARAPTRP